MSTNEITALAKGLSLSAPDVGASDVELSNALTRSAGLLSKATQLAQEDPERQRVQVLAHAGATILAVAVVVEKSGLTLEDAIRAGVHHLEG